MASVVDIGGEVSLRPLLLPTRPVLRQVHPLRRLAPFGRLCAQPHSDGVIIKVFVEFTAKLCVKSWPLLTPVSTAQSHRAQSKNLNGTGKR